MQTYADLVDLAKICLRRSRLAPNDKIAAELKRLAKEYQKQAAELSAGKLPDIDN
jgi:hypothetical protein